MAKSTAPIRRILIEQFIGRNGFDAPTKLLEGQCVEALNVDWYGSPLGRKRGGATAQSTSGGTAFSGAICSLFRHVPTADDTAAEEWGIDTLGIVKRLAAGTAWADVTLDDAIGSRPQDINAATFNGKLFTCYGVQSNTSTDTTNAATAGTNYTVAAGITQLVVKAWGAGGGAAIGGTNGGGGGFATATIPVTPGETLSKRVGGGGGGGGGTIIGGGGGGYTGLFRGTTPLIIAGAGGGSSLDANGGPGGGSSGLDGSGTYPGLGGTQSAGGAAGGGGAGPFTIRRLIVAGGGGGGFEQGGGGAGGDVLDASESIAAGSYAVTVGAAGAASAGGVGGNGGNSTFNGHTAVGGGGGGSGAAANSGGSNSTYSGGTGDGDGAPVVWAGGGGAGSAANGGAAPDVDLGGDGGVGTGSDISGATQYYGGGGAGGSGAVDGSRGVGGTGGAGGGGNGGGDIGNTAPQAGSTNTGGGGGGGHHLNNGAAGGSGVIIISYTTGIALATGGTITTSGGNTIHTFTANDTFLIGPVSPTAGSSLTGGTGGGWVSGGIAGGAGGTNGGGAGGPHGIATAQNVGGGGGAGYYGGGGGAGDMGLGTTGGGGGGSSYVSGTNTQTIAGSGLTPGGSTDADYAGNSGKGVVNASGNDGLLVIHATLQVDRLHVYDPNLASPRIRRVGLASTVAPTVANTGGGAYPAVLRYYRQRTIQLDAATSTKVIRRSEPSPSVSFTPSGAGTAARVTRATFPNEGETHWEIEASTDNVTFYRLSQVVIGTTTYDDSALVATYSSNPVSDLTGTYALPTAVKGIIATASRLLMAGAYVQGGKNNRIWWTPVLGSSDQGDDERIPTTLISYTDLSENAGDTFVGFAGPIFDGTVYVFMQREIWRLTPTGDPSAPFLTRQISDSVGAVHQKAIFQGEDESGQPCIYFTSYLGHYRLSRGGLQYLGRDNEDRWFGLNSQTAANLMAPNMVAHGLWHQAKHQAWFYQATGTNNDPDTKFCFDPKLGRPVSQGEVRGGWSIHTGVSCQARCSVLFSNTVGAQMSRDLKPYVGLAASATILKTDTTDQSDNSNAFQAYVISPPLTPSSLYQGRVGARDAQVQALAGSATIRLTLIANYGEYSNTADVSLAADSQAGTETRVLKKFAASAIANAENLQFQIGDASAVASAWSIDGLNMVLDYEGQE